MKILFVTNGYPTQKHPEYCVFTKEQIESVQVNSENISDIFFINAREKGKLEYVRSILPLKRKMKEYDIIHAFHGLSFLFVFFLAPNKNIVVSFLNSIDNEYGESKFRSKILVFITKRIIRRQNIVKIFKDKIPGEFRQNSYYLPNGVDLSKFFPIPKNEAKNKLNLDIHKRYILFVSSKNKFRKQKRYDRFNSVMEILKKDFNDIEELVLVNEPREKIVNYFNAAELHLLTSDYEGSPNSVKEAIACNIPVVTTNTGNVYEMINDIDYCYVSFEFEAEALANFCRKILNNKTNTINIYKKIIDKGLDINSKASELINIYQHIISKNGI